MCTKNEDCDHFNKGLPLVTPGRVYFWECMFDKDIKREGIRHDVLKSFGLNCPSSAGEGKKRCGLKHKPHSTPVFHGVIRDAPAGDEWKCTTTRAAPTGQCRLFWGLSDEQRNDEQLLRQQHQPQNPISIGYPKRRSVNYRYQQELIAYYYGNLCNYLESTAPSFIVVPSPDRGDYYAFPIDEKVFSDGSYYWVWRPDNNIGNTAMLNC
ncbi:uncharacterized protein LOC142350980 [Convolutriloba macropyga]|uniref:uncharacterized protein LOC142350980 n=1 Tax=Convolutriloba macropyga TaxID=536237 RepID=UPI003F51C5A2